MTASIASTLLFDLIRHNFAWGSVEYICENNPAIIELARSSANGTVLHEICAIGSAPNHIVEKVLRVWEGACLKQNKYGDTPLHAATRSSQISSGRTKLLVDCNADALTIRNNAGHTPLATALVSGACLHVIEMLVEKETSVLLMKDEHGQTPTQLLWSSFQQNIPGLLAIKSYFQGDVEMSNILKKFWIKFKYCSMESYKLTQNLRDASVDDRMLCHVILAQDLKEIFLHQALAIALIDDKELAMQTDDTGNNPLHVLVEKNKFKSIDVILKLCPCTARIKNKDGRKPLHIALDRLKESGARKIIMRIVEADVDALGCKDSSDGLYPFMNAAVFGDVQMTYEFLLERPLAGM